MSERDVFIAALRKPRGSERDTYLASACTEQQELQSKVEALLRLYESAQDGKATTQVHVISFFREWANRV